MTGKLLLLCATVLPLAADTYTFKFDCITNNKAADCATGEEQLFMDVYSAGPQVAFKFWNAGPNASSVTDIYFADDTLLLGPIAHANITNSKGVQFSPGASPRKLPSAPSGFVTTDGFSADSDPPTQPNGVNPGEWLTVTFDLQPGKSYGQTITALQNPALPTPGVDDLRIGIHVQGFSKGGSESFVTKRTFESPIEDPEPVPEPTSVMLLGTEMAFGAVVVFAGWIIRRRRAA